MPDLPPPTGPPVDDALHSDPWAEQARRHAAHLADRRSHRRRRLIRFGAPALVLLAVGIAAAVVISLDRHDEPVAASLTTLLPVAPETPNTDQRSASVEAASVEAASVEAASVEEVWLLDRGDGDYDWGAVVSSASDVLRRDLVVTMSLLDPDGAEVLQDEMDIAQLVPDGQAVVGGVVHVGDAAPTRIEVTATLGSAASNGGAARVALLDVRRISSGQVDRDDRLLGSVEVLDGDPSAARVAAMWRDEDGRVIASIFEVVSIGDSGQPADFSLRLPRSIVPAGPPDEIVADVAALN